MGRFDRLLNPGRIAVIGGGAWCASVIKQARKFGFSGDIVAVHPTREEIAGIATVRRVSDIEGHIDTAFVGVNREATIDVIRDLSDAGCGGAVCFASGFSEAGQSDLQERLVAAAGNMPILGPNCYGFVNAVDRVAIWPDQHGCTPVERGVAILTQSSNISINLTMQQRALPIAYMIACGNQAQTSQAILAETLLDDPRVTALGLHIEGFGDIHAWWRVAVKAHAKGVPVLALKVGASEQAQDAALSHTASLAGSDAGADALLRHLGFGRVQDLSTFLECLKLLSLYGPLDTPNLSSISCSGGEASLSADMAQDLPLVFPALTDAQTSQLSKALGPKVALANPLDYHTYIWRDVPAMTAAWSAMAAPHIGLTLSVVDYPNTDYTDWACTIDAAIAARAATNRPFGVVASLPELMPKDVAQRLFDAGVLPLNGLREALQAAAIAMTWPKMSDVPPLAAQGERVPLSLVSEAEAKAELAAYGMDVPKGVTSGQDIQNLTAPLAVKSLGLAHKTDAGGVRLGIHHADVPAVIASMPGETFLVEEMVEGSIAELLLAVRHDAAHGFVLTLGAGGVMTEILKDTVSLLLPASRQNVRKALESLKIWPLLDGFRGSPKASVEAILDATDALQRFATSQAHVLDEIEINPLICTTHRAVAVDALLRRQTT